MNAGIHFVRKRLASGGCRWYVYAWRGGPQIMWADGVRKPQLSRDAIKAAGKALEAKDEQRRPDSTLLLSLIRTWRSADPQRASSPEWQRLSANTKKTWGSALNKIEERWGNVPLAIFNDTRMIAKIIAWRDSRSETPRAADMGVTVLQALLKYGIQRGLLSQNIAAGIGKLYVNGQRADIVWTEDDLTAFAKAAGEIDQNVDDAVQLAGATGLRREDLARLTWDGIKEATVEKRATKKSRGQRRFATIPRTPALDGLLVRLRERHRASGVETVLVTSAGRAWNLDTLSKEVTRIARKANISHIDEETGSSRGKHLHDVRGTFATRLMTTTNLTNEEVASIMGWSPNEVERIRRIYVDDTARNVALGRRIAKGL